MKIIVLSKKYIFCFFILIIGIILFLSNLSSHNFFQNDIEALYPIDFSEGSKYDLTGDGEKDTIEIINGQNKIDYCIKCSNKNEYTLSKEVPDKTLFSLNPSYTPKIFIYNLSRNGIPQIILSGSKNNEPITYMFQWNKDKFKMLYSDSNNIFGILDSKNTRTPQCFSYSSGTNSLKSFMVINDGILDTSSENTSPASLDCALSFINIIELPYDLDELPDIFKPEIDRSELSLLWNLNKENNSYTFLNGFFYDYEWNDNSVPTSIKWHLSFSKNKIKGDNSKKDLFNLNVTLAKDGNSYKIVSIQNA